MTCSGGEVFCGQCGVELGEGAAENPRVPCSSCGSVVRRIVRRAIDVITKPRDGTIVKKYLAGKSKKKGLVLTAKSDLPKTRRDGLLVRETQVLDKENDRYVHRITDEDGKVLYENPKGERLSEHQGFGSAKTRPKAEEQKD